uniref:Uncharacterized protein n=1 Tax=Globodera rostochiensis TaxID=31243 RepID=A0A914H9R1_GLORO
MPSTSNAGLAVTRTTLNRLLPPQVDRIRSNNVVALSDSVKIERTFGRNAMVRLRTSREAASKTVKARRGTELVGAGGRKLSPSEAQELAS